MNGISRKSKIMQFLFTYFVVTNVLFNFCSLIVAVLIQKSLPFTFGLALSHPTLLLGYLLLGYIGTCLVYSHRFGKSKKINSEIHIEKSIPNNVLYLDSYRKEKQKCRNKHGKTSIKK